jgi:hypothetical protein
MWEESGKTIKNTRVILLTNRDLLQEVCDPGFPLFGKSNRESFIDKVNTLPIK